MSNEALKEFVNKQRMKTVEMTEDTKEIEEIEAPIFELIKWRKEHLPDTPEMRAYIRAQNEQKALIIVLVLMITVIVNYLKYGVP